MSLHLNIEFKLSHCNYILLRGNQFHSTSDIETGRKEGKKRIVAHFLASAFGLGHLAKINFQRMTNI